MKGMIVFSSVSKSFAGQPTAIVNFSLEVAAGELVVITGPSGAGKTTLMKLLIKEYTPESGQISFDQQDLQQLKAKHLPELRRKIGVVFQDYKLIEDMNIWENIALPLYIANKKQTEIESRVTDLLKLIGLTDKAMHFPRQLSGGEAQRVSIARALASAPLVLFADEPTGNLDPAASLKIVRLLKKINELGTTVLFATHDDLVLKELAGAKLVHLEKKTAAAMADDLTASSKAKTPTDNSKTSVKTAPAKKLSLTDTEVDSAKDAPAAKDKLPSPDESKSKDKPKTKNEAQRTKS